MFYVCLQGFQVLECSKFPGISVEVQDMVNDVDIDGDSH